MYSLGISDPNHILKRTHVVFVNFQRSHVFMKTITFITGIAWFLVYASAVNSGNLEAQNEQMQIDQMKAEALNGNEKLQMKLASMFMHGKGGVTADIGQAIYWYTVAAEQDIGYAQQKLAHIYLQGTGVERSHEKALYWLNRAANLGFVEAQLELSSLYEHGNLIPQDLVSAHKWLSIAASLAELDVESRQAELESKMSFVQLAKSKYLSGKCMLQEYKDC